MSLWSVILAFIPAFFYPLDSTSIILLSEPYVEFNEVPVWYFRAIDKSTTQILANGVYFSVPMTVKEVSNSFPDDLFLNGQFVSKFKGIRQTNYIFIRKDCIAAIHRHVGRKATITLQTFTSNRPAEEVRFTRLNKEK